jgi:hypothetical protein
MALSTALPGHDHAARPGSRLRAVVGDTLIIGTASEGRLARTGEIIEVLGSDGAPPYRVRWLAGEYESVITPGSGARVRKGHL